MYVVEGDKLVPLSDKKYATEDELQELVARFPEVLNGDESATARRYALVRREHGVAGSADGGDRWSVDHVFIDQDAIPVLVEVKRASDTRIRREVVGQILDYAANAAEYWAEGRLRAEFDTACAKRKTDPTAEIVDLTGTPDQDVDAFWAEVDSNVRRGRIRLIFCSDEIPKELRRIAEFLNAQTRETEVLALELPQRLTSTGVQVLSPRLFGQSLQTPSRPTGKRARRVWTLPDYFELLAQREPALEPIARKLVEEWQGRGLRVAFGNGTTETAVFPTIDHGAASYWLVGIYPTSVVIQFEWLKIRPGFETLAAREEIRRRFNEIDGVSIPDQLGGRPSFPTAILLDPDRLKAFRGVLAWFETAVHKIPIADATGLVKPEEDQPPPA